MNNCNGNGECVWPNICKCKLGYTEVACRYKVKANCSEFNDCSGNGKCKWPNTCECKKGYSGLSCEKYTFTCEDKNKKCDKLVATGICDKK